MGGKEGVQGSRSRVGHVVDSVSFEEGIEKYRKVVCSLIHDNRPKIGSSLRVTKRCILHYRTEGNGDL